MKQQIQSSVDKLKVVWSRRGNRGQGKDPLASHLHLVQVPSLWLTPEPPVGSITQRGCPGSSSGHAVPVTQGCPSVGSARPAVGSQGHSLQPGVERSAFLLFFFPQEGEDKHVTG